MIAHRASKRAMLDRAIGRAVSLFSDLLSEAKLGHSVDALKLQRHLNEIADRTNRITYGDLKEGR